MGLFDRFKKKKEAPASGYDRMSVVENDPNSWNALEHDELKQLVIMKCMEYRITHNGSRIPRLFALDADETEPEVIPKSFEVWEYPERFRGRIS